MFAYVEADMSESGKLDELTKKCSSLSGFWPLVRSSIKTQHENSRISGFDFDTEFVPLMRSDLAIGIDFSEKLDDPIESVMFLGHAKTEIDGGFKKLTEKMKLVETETVKKSEEKIGELNMVSIVVDTEGKKIFFAYTLIKDNEILFSNNQTMLREAILREMERGESIEDSQKFVETFDSVYTKDTVGSIYIDYEKYISFTKKHFDKALIEIKDESLRIKMEENFEDLLSTSYITAFKSAAFSLNIASEGVKFKSRMYVDNSALPKNYNEKNLNSELTKYVPIDNFGWYYSSDLSFTAALAKEVLSADPAVKNMMADFEEQTKINIADDVMGWMKDEYIFTMLAHNPKKSVNPYRFVAIVEAPDKEKTLESWGKIEGLLSAIFKKSNPVKNEFTDVKTPGGYEARMIDILPSLDTVLIYGYLPGTDYLVISNSATAIDEVIEVAKNGENVSKNEYYGDIITEQKYISSFGVNMEKILNSSLFLKKNAGMYPFRKIRYLGGISQKVNTGFDGELNLIIQKK